ncbi:hypothetical protein D6D01_05007 [Aureobasidium pullulans]|uniref:Uncharacterized protein n=1 Tax=Aureobasidium pullulans TaxID=5580 RepID=A0A4S9L8W7_AURPU|nr:hypothetical protein D6D01_05007 [Aureobasidium pullulans]
MTTGNPNAPNDLTKQLCSFKWDEAASKAAIRVEKIPGELDLGLTKLCVVRGVRYHDGFGKEPHGVLPLFTRALNVSSIMSGRISEIDDHEDETPYCNWHPQIASESTYRELVRKYPHMVY